MADFDELLAQHGLDRQAVPAMIHAGSRDNARTPMPWNDGGNAEFSDGTPQIKIDPNDRAINVRRAAIDPDSVLHYYRRSIRLRRKNPIIAYGGYELLCEAYDRRRTLAGNFELQRQRIGFCFIGFYPFTKSGWEILNKRPYS